MDTTRAEEIQGSTQGSIEQEGPWPFVTRRIQRLADRSRRVWSSRHHRKRLLVDRHKSARSMAASLLQCVWMPWQLNWWIGVIFTLGSLLFALASILSLAPALSRSWSLDSQQINAIFFAGSIPFTSAAYLQLYQSANADKIQSDGSLYSGHRRFFGWQPRDVGWLSTALQFAGTVLFNFSTFDAMIPTLSWFQEDLLIWVPNIVGSVLFLTSGYLAFIETCHSHWAWCPRSISWWVVFTGLLGCVGFMVSALFAMSFPDAHPEAATTSIAFTLFGALGFSVSSLLMLPETAALS